MKVVGLTDGLRGDAERQCAAGFRAWIAEAGQGTWSGWDELKRHYPAVSRMSDDEAHFPLTSDGIGVRAQVFFPAQLLILCCIAAAPLTTRPPHRRQLFSPPTPQQKQANQQ